MLSTINQLTNR